MLNRRHIRIKVMQALYAHYTEGEGDVKKSQEALFFSFDKMYEMYIYLFSLIIEMQGAAIEKIEAGKNKKLPTQEDLHPNTKFVTNRVIRTLVHSKSLKKAADDTGVSWADQKELVKKVFKDLIETEDYKEYMESDERGFDHDREFLLRFFKRHMINVELLHDFFEEKSIFWNDDLDIVSSMTIKTIKTISDGDDDVNLLELWDSSDDEELEFAKNLFVKTLSQGEENEKFIQESTKNWEIERIASLDTILMKMALAEARTFETVPLKVTLNEYIELSKYYSTPKSNGFINGVLDQLFAKLKEDGVIKKIGRGLLQ
ncbi:transcription antitermination protein NusB [Sanyastnella coralliicola]|uniref:transcription antitermination protein NusB n=1 Tax=Sanyastnella coralliicola TaxID=3069118 RepID=UPI0027B8F2D7|nr:transcription antitermination protein NusB [Longitalea sp. SCSIO 12813]